jgi:hypothetical protein
VIHTCNPIYSEAEIRKIEVQSQPRANSSQGPTSKKKKKRAGGVAQVVEDLPSKREALRSNPMLKKKQQGKKPAG